MQFESSVSKDELDELFAPEKPIGTESYDKTAEQYNLKEEEDILKYDIPQDEVAIDSEQIDELFGEDEEYLTEPTEEMIDNIEELFYEQPEIVSNIEPQDEIVKSEFNIDDEKGFYLVDFEDTTALVGHIDEEIFVLKRFDKKINGPLQARLDERKENSTNYMTKVGSFRGLVEVTPQNMNLLIEL
jgi:hypothetical protein